MGHTRQPVKRKLSQKGCAATRRRAEPARCPAVGRCRTYVGRSDDDVVESVSTEAFDGRTDDRGSAYTIERQKLHQGSLSVWYKSSIEITLNYMIWPTPAKGCHCQSARVKCRALGARRRTLDGPSQILRIVATLLQERPRKRVVRPTVGITRLRRAQRGAGRVPAVGSWLKNSKAGAPHLLHGL